jgi:HAE1 family hydrophobic/amphiphilic exporter-1
MGVTDRFIRKPVMTTLVVLGMLFFGVIGYESLPVSYLPEVEFPTLQVSASLPGASASTMAASVATPLEKQFTSIPGILSMNSQNTQGSTSITLQFSLDRDIDGCASDTQAAISKAQGNMPIDQMPQPPYYSKENPADDPILYFFISSDSLPLYEVNEYAETFVSDAISMVEGVSEVMIYGESKLAVRVQVDSGELISRGMGLDTLMTKVADQNVMLPLGTLDGKHRSLTLEATGQLKKAQEYEPSIVMESEGAVVRLSDVAKVINGIQADKVGSWLGPKRGVTMAVKKQPGANTIKVVETIKKLLPTIRAQIPASISMREVYNKAEYIQEAVDDVLFTLKVAIALVVAVVFLFLRNVSATLISGAAIPVSIVVTFALMYVFGYSLDTLSLLALTLSVGFVVDDAIVMIENVVSHLEQGKKPFQAALDGSRQITFTIISMTLSLAVVFIPVMFMSGIIGRILREFAMTITIAILASGVVSLTMTPMLCSRFLRPSANRDRRDGLFTLLTRAYKWSLHLAMRHSKITLLAAALILAGTIHLFIVIPKGFLPTDDMSYLMGFTQAMQGVSYKSNKRHMAAVREIVEKNPNVSHVIQVTGYPVLNQGFIIPMLKPPKERKDNADQTAIQLMRQANVTPGILAWFTNPPMIRLETKQTKNLYQYTIQAPNQDELYELAAKFLVKLQGLPMLTGVTSDMMINNPEVWINIDRDKASFYGVSAYAIENALDTAYAERKISTIYGDTDQYWVIMQVDHQYQKDERMLSQLYVTSSSGKLIRLDQIAEFKLKPGPIQVNHTGQLPSVTFSFNIAEGRSMSEATGAIHKLAETELPASVTTSFEGSAGEFASSMASMTFLLFVAIAVIYMILGILYESFIHPITIISGLPSAAIGGLLTLRLFGCNLDLFGMVGVIMLIGIVKKNAIMVVDFAIEAEEKHHLSPADAAFEGALERFRPILMTTVAAIAGAMPIALGYGASAQARQPMGLAIVGGLIISQVVTLYLTPVVYIYMDSFQRWINKRGEKKREMLGIPETKTS